MHSMEHGAVWIVYSPELDATQVGVVKALGGNPYVLISPWASKLASPIMVQAWGLQLALPNATDPRLKQFLTTYASGPQTPEPGVQCLGGGTMTV